MILSPSPLRKVASSSGSESLCFPFPVSSPASPTTFFFFPTPPPTPPPQHVCACLKRARPVDWHVSEEQPTKRRRLRKGSYKSLLAPNSFVVVPCSSSRGNSTPADPESEDITFTSSRRINRPLPITPRGHILPPSARRLYPTRPGPQWFIASKQQQPWQYQSIAHHNSFRLKQLAILRIQEQQRILQTRMIQQQILEAQRREGLKPSQRGKAEKQQAQAGQVVGMMGNVPIRMGQGGMPEICVKVVRVESSTTPAKKKQARRKRAEKDEEGEVENKEKKKGAATRKTNPKRKNKNVANEADLFPTPPTTPVPERRSSRGRKAGAGANTRASPPNFIAIPNDNLRADKHKVLAYKQPYIPEHLLPKRPPSPPDEVELEKARKELSI